MSMSDVFELDTKNFHTALVAFETMSKKIRDAKADFDNLTLKARANWDGDARAEFESLHRNMSWQLGDIVDYSWGIYEDLLEANEAYIKADVAMQKSLDGVSNRY